MPVEYFVCQVEYEGYEFQTLPHLITGEEYRVLVPRAPGTETIPRKLSLFESSPLWREFSELNPTEEVILAFASKYGALFPDAETPLTGHSQSSKPKSPSILVVHTNGSTVDGERFGMWKAHIEEMKRLSDLWDLLQSKDPLESKDQLKRQVIQHTHSKNKWVFVSRPRIYELMKSGQHRDPETHALDPKKFLETDFAYGFETPENFENPTPEVAARHYLLENINEMLIDIRPKIAWDMTKPLSKHLDLILRPKSLKDALWLQFAQAVTRGTNFEQCIRCKKWFQLGTKNSQKKLYCGNACNQAAWRARKLA
jgi:hypothetical protein